MNVAYAAQKTLDGLFSASSDEKPTRDPAGKSLSHAYWMLKGISEEYIQYEKAHRWLGYAQALLVSHGVLTLGEAKEINHTSTTGSLS